MLVPSENPATIPTLDLVGSFKVVEG